MALDPSSFLSTPAGYASPGQQAQAQQLSDLATPQQIQAMYDYAKALKTQSTDTPVHAWTQGVSNIVKALMGNVETNRAADAERGLVNAQANAAPDMSDGSAQRPGDLPSSTDSARPKVSGGDQTGLSTEGYSNPALAMAESGGSDTAKNPMSSATGRYQFTDGTWKDLSRRHPELDLTPNGRTDPAQQEKAKVAFDQDNAQTLQTAGYDPTPGNLNLAHRFGAQGATKVLGADPNAPMSQIEPQNVMAINPDLRNATAGSTIQRYASLGSPQVPGAPALPPDAQNMTRALAGNTQVAQNGPMQPGMGGQQPDPRAMIAQMAANLIRAYVPPAQAYTQATQYVSNMLALGPQYQANAYGQEMVTRPGMPAQFTGRQLLPGKEGPAFHGFSTMETVGPNGVQQQIIVPQVGGPPAQAASGPQGAAPAPTNVGAAAPSGPFANAPQSAQAAMAANAPSSVNLAGPAPQGTQVAEPPAPAPKPDTNEPFSAPPAGGSMGDLLKWQTNLDAAQKGAVASAEAQAKAVAEGRVKPIEDAVKQGVDAAPIINDLKTIRNAYAANKDNLGGGPFADTVLKVKQGINEFLGDNTLVDQDKSNAQAIVQKLNMGLATKIVKELTPRGTQMEILLAMKNTPGILMNDKASLYMLDIMTQIQQQKQELGVLASQKGYDNPREWAAMQRNYYDTHPIISPFTHKPIDESYDTDRAELLPKGSTPAQQQGQPGFNVPPPAAPADIKSPEDLDAWINKMGLKSGEPFTLHDGRPGRVP